jgi:hypothetical protein
MGKDIPIHVARHGQRTKARSSRLIVVAGCSLACVVVGCAKSPGVSGKAKASSSAARSGATDSEPVDRANQAEQLWQAGRTAEFVKFVLDDRRSGDTTRLKLLQIEESRGCWPLVGWRRPKRSRAK